MSEVVLVREYDGIAGKCATYRRLVDDVELAVTVHREADQSLVSEVRVVGQWVQVLNTPTPGADHRAAIEAAGYQIVEEETND